MPQIYEVWNLDRYNAGLKPYKYSGSDYHDNPAYIGSSKHPDYKSHCKNANLAKYCLISFSKDFVTPQELRKLESMIQQKENHAYNPDYYNMTNNCQPDPSHPLTRNKISITNKNKDIKPTKTAIMNAHTKEACNKRSIKMKDYKWFHHPDTLISIKCLPENAPDDYLLGRKPKKQYPQKKQRSEILFNTRDWKIYKDNVLFWEGKNLKAFCRKHEKLKYLYSNKNKSITVKTFTCYKIYKENNIIYLNDEIYRGSQKQLAKELCVSPSVISNAINTTNILKIVTDITTYKASRG